MNADAVLDLLEAAMAWLRVHPRVAWTLVLWAVATFLFFAAAEVGPWSFNEEDEP